MKHEKILEQNIVMENKISLHNYFGWPSITRLKNGALAAVASGARLDHVCPFGKAVMSISYDEGKTWTLPTPIIDTPLDDRDAGILAYGESSVIVTSFNNTIEFQRHWNGLRDGNLPRMEEGQAKEKYRLHTAYANAYLDFLKAQGDEYIEKYYGTTYRISHDNGVTWGDIKISPVTSPHGPLETKEGKLLWIGRYSSDLTHPPLKEEIACYEIREDGDPIYYGSIPNIPTDTGRILSCEPYAIELPDGRILVHIRAEGRGANHCFTTYQSISTDGGHTFSNPVRLLDEEEGAPSHILLHSSGKLIAAIGHRKAPFGIRILTSCNLGENWEESILTDDAMSLDLGYPATVELKDGTLYTIFYQRMSVQREGYIETEPSIIRGVHWTL